MKLRSRSFHQDSHRIMFLESLWTALRFVQWEDTISFHVTLFRCFLLGFLDAYSELAVLSRGSERMWAVLGQRLAGMALMYDAGHLHDPLSNRAAPLGIPMQCPPKWIYEATPLPPFARNSPMDQMMPVPPFVFPQPINITHGLYNEPWPPAVAFDLPGSIVVLGCAWHPLTL